MYVLLLVKVSLCIALFAKRGSGCVLPRQSMHEQGMRVVPQNPSIHRFMQGQWSPGQVFFLKSSDVMPRNLCQRNLKTSRRFRLLWTLFGQRSDNNFGHNPCDVDFGQIPGDDNFGCIPAAGNFWSLSRSQRERGTVTVPQSIHSHNLNSNPGRFTVNFTLSSLNRY